MRIRHPDSWSSWLRKHYSNGDHLHLMAGVLIDSVDKPDVICELIESLPDLDVNARVWGWGGKTLFHIACIYSEPVAFCIMNHANVDYMKVSSNGESAVTCAIDGHNIRLLRHLVYEKNVVVVPRDLSWLHGVCVKSQTCTPDGIREILDIVIDKCTFNMCETYLTICLNVDSLHFDTDVCYQIALRFPPGHRAFDRTVDTYMLHKLHTKSCIIDVELLRLLIEDRRAPVSERAFHAIMTYMDIEQSAHHHLVDFMFRRIATPLLANEKEVEMYARWKRELCQTGRDIANALPCHIPYVIRQRIAAFACSLADGDWFIKHAN